MSNPSLYSMPAGDIAVLIGAEVRAESMEDLRDPRINGQIKYSTPPEAANQTTFPYISDIVNSSPSPNTEGDRVVTSLFAEAQIPLFENVDSQIAVRVENADDYGTNTVGKIALGYSPTNWLKIRTSGSTIGTILAS